MEYIKGTDRRVVITGTGAITPVGNNVVDTWNALLECKSGIGPFTLIEPREHRTQVLCEVKNFDPKAVLGRKEARRRDRYQQLATVAAAEAMAQSGLEINDDNRYRTGIVIGTGIGGIQTLVDQESVVNKGNLRRLSPYGITMIMPNGAAGMLAIDYGIHGPSTTIATACAAGCDAIGHAYRAISRGDLDIVITGGTESIITHVALAGFEQARATSSRSTKTPRPFDKDRDGLVVGEGAAILILESLENALNRGATILGEIAGYGQTTDAFHITAPAAGGSGAARAMSIAIKDAGLQPEDVDYVSAHGTGTKLNDAAETEAIKTALGNHAYDVVVSSTKSMTGHIMGATGAIETILCALIIQEGIIPPTINYSTPDPECDLDYVPNSPRNQDVEVCLNNAFGFGGHNAVLAIKKYVS